MELLQDYLNVDVVTEGDYQFGQSQRFVLPDNLVEYEDYLVYIRSLPSGA